MKNAQACQSHPLYSASRKAGSLSALRRKLWVAIIQTERLLLDPETPPDGQLKAIHALATTSGVYITLMKDAELERRLEAVERLAQTAVQRRNGHGVA